MLIFTVLIASGCQKASTHTLILDYEDFGPQAMAWETIGMEWWQWDSHGDDDPDTRYPIHVAVYRDITLDEVKILFPVDRGREQDFRYLHYDEAVKYLEKKINELEAMEEEWAVSLRQKLMKTRQGIRVFYDMDEREKE